jgi:hypothetical protein
VKVLSGTASPLTAVIAGRAVVAPEDEEEDVPIEEPTPPAVTTPFVVEPVVSEELASAERT